MRFRVLSYNIHRAIGVDRKFRPDRIAAILQRYDADLVLLQEVDSGAPRSRMLDLAAHLAERVQYDHHVVGLNQILRVGRFGNATLSKFPIVRQRNIDLTLGALKGRGAQHTQIYLPCEARTGDAAGLGTFQAGVDGWATQVHGGKAARAFRHLRAHRSSAAERLGRVTGVTDERTTRAGAHAHARVAVDRSGPMRASGPKRLIGVVPLDVFNVHLSLTARMRRRQIAHLLRVEELDQLAPEAPCIIAGDMNDWGGLLKRRLLAPAGFVCATNRRPGSRWALKTYPSYAPTGGLDKIFYRGPLKLVRVYRSRLALARLASDHLPVIAEFELTVD